MSDRERLADARHDLGKYVSFNIRFLPKQPSTDELREALKLDVLSTRSGPGGQQPAWEVWERVRPGTGFEEVDALVQRLREADLDGASPEELEALAATCRRISAILDERWKASRG